MQPANDYIDPNVPLRLADVIKYGFPQGGMTVSGLRNEARITLRDAATYITKLPKAEHDTEEWQAAMEALLCHSACKNLNAD